MPPSVPVVVRLRAGRARRYAPLLAVVPLATGAALLLSAGEPETTAAVARTSGAQLCLDTGDDGLVCLGDGHDGHLPASGVADGACVRVSYVGSAVTDRTVVDVSPATCTTGRPR